MRAKWMPWAVAAMLVAGALVGAGAAMAGPPHAAKYAYGRVVDVEPIVRHVTVKRPRRECRQELVYEAEPEPFGEAGTAIAGAIVGGAVGRQFGRGSGRDAMTLLGSIAGAAVAHERAERRAEAQGRRRGRAVPVERCNLVHERVTERRVDGYRVTYRYDGRDYTMRTSEPPPDRIRLRVSVQPVGF